MLQRAPRRTLADSDGASCRESLLMPDGLFDESDGVPASDD